MRFQSVRRNTLLCILAVGLTAPTWASAPAFAGGVGYEWLDSNDVGGPSFSPLGAGTPTGIVSDDGEATVSLPFTFSFFETPQSVITVGANGAIAFVSGASIAYSNACPLTASSNRLMPYWDDLDGAAGTISTGTSGSSPNRIFVIEWSGVPHLFGDGAVTFEVQLHETTGVIEYHYTDAQFASASYDYGESATIGLTSSTEAIEVGCNTTSLSDSYAIAFYPGGVECNDLDGDTWTNCDGDCDDDDSTVNPDASESCDGIDNDCNGEIDEDFDIDGDGWFSCDGDCNDTDPDVNPEALENCDGIDNDCDLEVDEGWDDDDDGFTSCGGDCDDSRSDIYPGAPEVAGDGIDQDCDGQDDPIGDDDDAANDDDDAADDDDDGADDDDDGADDDDDDDDSAADDDDDDGGGRGGRARTGCVSMAGGAPNGLMVSLLVLLGLGARRASLRRPDRS